MTDSNSQRSISSWIELLKRNILVSDVDDATVAAICCHLADLEVLEKSGKEGWKLIPDPEGSLAVEEEIKKRLYDLCATDQGLLFVIFEGYPGAPDHK